MKTIKYNRSSILSFYDLTDSQQHQQSEEYGEEIAEGSQYVIFNGEDGEEVLPLHMFIKCESFALMHGVYALTAFSAYCITLSRCGSEAIISYRVS